MLGAPADSTARTFRSWSCDLTIPIPSKFLRSLRLAPISDKLECKLSTYPAAVCALQASCMRGY